ncbi:MAG: TlpA family protein disulfide reductase [Azonexus sp.]|jgi:thiol-disulfide isomerase/thioredoxin|nr:TlpA family protein disulfide reductase [Azonexus sp.]
MKWLLPLLLPLFMLAASPAVQASAADQVAVPVGGRLTEATLYGLPGVANKKLSSYRGKPLIINVWASWCSPCRQEMASLSRLAKRFHGKEFNVIGVSTDDRIDDADYFVKRAKLGFPAYLDSRDFYNEGMVGAKSIPLTVLVSADGKVLKKVSGALEWDDAEVVKTIGETFGMKLR